MKKARLITPPVEPGREHFSRRGGNKQNVQHKLNEMKRKILLLACTGILVLIPMIVLQSSAPTPLPPATSVTITGIPETSQDDYAFRVSFNGIEYITLEAVQSEDVAYGPFNSSETFMADHKMIETINYDIDVALEVRATSGHQWSTLGIASSWVGTNKSKEGNWLISFTLDWDDFVNP